MKSVKIKSSLGLARVAKKEFSNWADFALLRDEKGLYILPFAEMKFPSSNNDEVIFRNGFSIGSATANSIASRIEEVILINNQVVRIY